MSSERVESAGGPTLEVSDIQATVLRPRPSPYKGEYIVLRIDDAAQGREMLRRIIPYVAPAEEWWVPSIPALYAVNPMMHMSHMDFPMLVCTPECSCKPSNYYKQKR